jgi:hypothetical protein
VNQTVASETMTNTFYAFNLLGNGHAGGVMNFEADGLRIENANDNSRIMHSQWQSGTIHWVNRDESSQAGLRNIANPYDFYELIDDRGPVVTFINSQLMGTHTIYTGIGDAAQQTEFLYQGVDLLDNPTFAHFINQPQGGNTGGLPNVRCDHCRNGQNSATTGFQEIVDTDLNWHTSTSGQTTLKSKACVSSNSDWPSTAGGSFEVRLPLNAMLVDIKYSNPSGSGGSATAYSYLIQTTDATPVVLLTVSGSNAQTPVPSATPITNAGTSTANFIMSTDTARTIQIKENAGRASIFTGMYCQLDYIGDLWTPLHPINDEDYGRKAA